VAQRISEGTADDKGVPVEPVTVTAVVIRDKPAEVPPPTPSTPTRLTSSSSSSTPPPWSASNPRRERPRSGPKGTMNDSVLVDIVDGVATVTLNEPDKRNAMSPQLHADCDDALFQLATDPETRVLILTGAGRAFCAR